VDTYPCPERIQNPNKPNFNLFYGHYDRLISLLIPNEKGAGIPQSVQRWATDWTIGVLCFDSRRGLGIFLFTTASRTALGPTQPPIQWVPRALSLGVKRPGREADHSPPSRAEVKNAWSYTSTPPIRLHGVSTGTNLPLYEMRGLIKSVL
jgi:hypothetical protein